jgi:hypothetical protein
MITQAELPSLVLVLVGSVALFATYLGIFAFTGLERGERARVRAALRGLRVASPRAAGP